MLKVITILVTVLALAAGAALAEEVEFKTSDGFVLKGEYQGARPGAPTVLLMHQLGSDHREFKGLAALFAEAKVNVLSYDARGHGESVWKSGKKVTYKQFDDQAFAAMTKDIDAALAFLKENKGLDGAPVGLVGSSIQSSTALLYASNHPEITTLTMLSPGIGYHNIDTAGPMKEYGKRPVFIAVSRGDEYSAESAANLVDMASGTKRIEVMDGPAHGVAMFAKNPKLSRLVVDWTTARLAEATPKGKKQGGGK